MKKIPRFFTGKYTTEQLVKNKWRGEKNINFGVSLTFHNYTCTRQFSTNIHLVGQIIKPLPTINIPGIVTKISIKSF